MLTATGSHPDHSCVVCRPLEDSELGLWWHVLEDDSEWLENLGEWVSMENPLASAMLWARGLSRP